MSERKCFEDALSGAILAVFTRENERWLAMGGSSNSGAVAIFSAFTGPYELETRDRLAREIVDELRSTTDQTLERLRSALEAVLPWVGVYDDHMSDGGFAKREAAELYATRVLNGDTEITLESAAAELERIRQDRIARSPKIVAWGTES